MSARVPVSGTTPAFWSLVPSAPPPRLIPGRAGRRGGQEGVAMANTSLFQSIVGKLLPRPDATNEAGGAAYRLSPKGALAQLAATGCLNATYYATDREQLQRLLALAAEVEPAFVP